MPWASSILELHGAHNDWTVCESRSCLHSQTSFLPLRLLMSLFVFMRFGKLPPLCRLLQLSASAVKTIPFPWPDANTFHPLLPASLKGAFISVLSWAATPPPTPPSPPEGGYWILSQNSVVTRALWIFNERCYRAGERKCAENMITGSWEESHRWRQRGRERYLAAEIE